MIFGQKASERLQSYCDLVTKESTGVLCICGLHQITRGRKKKKRRKRSRSTAPEQDLDSDQHIPEVNTMYKRVGQKVKPINDSTPDGSTPPGDINWKAARLAAAAEKMSQQPASKYNEWIQPKFSDLDPSDRLTPERTQALMEKNCEDFTDAEKEMFLHMFRNRIKALAWEFSEMGQIIDEVAPPQEIRTVPHEPFQSRSIPIPHALKDDVIKILKDRIDRGILEESHASYRNKWFLVMKKDGKLRLINDAQRYNAFTIKDALVPPASADFSREFGMCKVLSLLDFFSGYDQVTLHENSRDMTTFATLLGLFRYCRLPMGATNSVAQFMRVMLRMFHDLIPHVCSPFLDDIAIKGPNTTYEDEEVEGLPGVRKYIAEHIRNTDQVLLNVELAGGTISAAKSEWCKKKVDIVGYFCGTDGRQPQDRKIEKLYRLLEVKNLSDVRSLMGLCVYYREWVPKFAIIAIPIYALMKKGAVFLWEKIQAAAARSIVDWIAKRTALISIDYTKLPLWTVFVTIDASLEGWGVELSQLVEGVRKPVCWESGTWTEAAKRYDATKRECRAVLFALHSLRFHLYGCRFVLETDALVLVQQLNGAMSDVPGALINRWIGVIKQFDFEVRHIPGIRNPVADALSRSPVQDTPEIAQQEDDAVEAWCDDRLNLITFNETPVISRWDRFKFQPPWYHVAERIIAWRNDVLPYKDSEAMSRSLFDNLPYPQDGNDVEENDDETEMIQQCEIQKSSESHATTMAYDLKKALVPDQSQAMFKDVQPLESEVTYPLADGFGVNVLRKDPNVGVNVPTVAWDDDQNSMDSWTDVAYVGTNVDDVDPNVTDVGPNVRNVGPNVSHVEPDDRDVRPDVADEWPNVGHERSDDDQEIDDVRSEIEDVPDEQRNVDDECLDDRKSGPKDDDESLPTDPGAVNEDAEDSDQDSDVLTRRLEWSEKSRKIARFLVTGNVPSRMRTKAQKSLTAEALKFQVIDKALWRRPEGKFERRRVIDDPDFRKMIIRECHAKFGHRGREATINRIRGLYYWRGLTTQVADAIRTCEVCQLYDAQRQDEGILSTKPDLPFSRINLDVCSVPDNQGYLYFVQARDDLTGWCWARAIRRNTADTIRTFLLEEVIYDVGCPLKLVVDGGPENKAELRDCLASLGIRRVQISSYNSRAAGQVEVGHQSLLNVLRKMSGGEANWKRNLGLAVFVDRTTVRRSTQCTPFFLKHGFEAVLPIESDIPTWRVLNWDSNQSAEQLIENRIRILEAKDKDVEKAIAVVAAYRRKVAAQRGFYGRERKEPLQVDELVLVYDNVRKMSHTRMAKLAYRWQGPFLVSEALSARNYKLKTMDGIPLRGTYASSRLKPFRKNESGIWEPQTPMPWEDDQWARGGDRAEKLEAVRMPMDKDDDAIEVQVGDTLNPETAVWVPEIELYDDNGPINDDQSLPQPVSFRPGEETSSQGSQISTPTAEASQRVTRSMAARKLEERVQGAQGRWYKKVDITIPIKTVRQKEAELAAERELAE